MHTRSTLNYQLPQFDSTDKPTWLGDINGAFLAIDSAMHENATNAGEAKTAATSALAALNGALERAQSADTKATQALATANSASATATEALTTATAASTSAAATATALADARLKRIWHVADRSATQAPGTVELSNLNLTNKVFVLAFLESNSSEKNIAAITLNGQGIAKAVYNDINLVSGAIERYYREIILVQNGDDIEMTIGACNKISTDGSTASASVDNTMLILSDVYMLELPTT